MKTLREYKEQIVNTAMIALIPTMITLTVVLGLC